MKKILLTAALCLCACAASAKPYLDIQKVKTESGITAWFVQDKITPVLSIQFSVKGGAQLDPTGREGLAELLSTLFDEGAGARDAEAFQDAMDQYGIKMGFTATRDSFSGSLKTTTVYMDMGVELFSDALNHPHFDVDAIARMKQAVQSNQRFSQMDPGWMANKALFENLFPLHAYGRLVDGTNDTIAAITPADIKKQKDVLLCRDRLKISVVGAADVNTVKKIIDQIFGSFPKCLSELAPVTKPTAAKEIHVDYKGAQSIVMMAQPGLNRNDRDWWAARILDFALGGGQFSSRLMKEIRVKRGLTYGIGTSLAPFDLAPLWFVQSSTAPDKVDEMIALTKKIWGDVAKTGLTDAEIDEAKSYMIGMMPLALTSTGQIASIVLQLQEDDLPVDMLDRRAGEINAVTSADIKRVAAERLKPDAFTIVVVGPVSKEEKKK